MSQAIHKIPLNKQSARAIGGLDIGHIAYEESLKHAHALKSHRDEYYVLVILIKGKRIVQCDMEKNVVEAQSILLVKPYQVHSSSTISKDAEAYFISIEPFLMPDHCSHIFQNLTISQQYLKIPSAEKLNVINTAALLHQAFTETNPFKNFIIHNLFNALINRITALFADAEKKVVKPKNQAYVITQNFKQLVSDNSFLHSPSFFQKN